LKGGFFLRRKPLNYEAPDYGYSEFAIAVDAEPELCRDVIPK
jgi:hypothetical protein